MTTEGFVKLPRTMLEWGWLDDENTLKVYLVLLLSANWKDGEWHGIKVRRGQLITGRKKLAEKCRLSEQNIRTALEHLKSTNEITIEAKRKFSIITINNYDPDQNSNQQINQTINQQLTNVQPTANQPLTTIEERKEEKEIKEREEAPSPSFISPESSVTKDELIRQYGIENVSLYETKFSHWAAKKGITDFANLYPTIARWLAADNVQKPHGSSFDMGCEWNKIVNRYKT